MLPSGASVSTRCSLGDPGARKHMFGPREAENASDPGNHMAPQIEKVETEDEYIHVRFRDASNYDKIRTPDWAQDVAESVSEGAEVRTGKKKGSDDWEVQAVLIKKSVGEAKAQEQARKIVEKIES